MLMGKATVLFDGRVGSQWMHIWLEWRGGDVVLSSQELGPALVPYFGEEEIEVFLTVEAAHLPQLARALGCQPTSGSIEAALVDRYHGDSSAVSHLSALLKEHDIRHEYFVI